MSLKEELETAWQEWKHGAEILVFFVIYVVVGAMLAMLPSIAIAEIFKWVIGDASRDMTVFIYCSIFLSIALVPFMAGAAMEEWKEVEDEDLWKGLEP